MSIRKKLYVGFGSILGVMVCLYLLYVVANLVEHGAKNAMMRSMDVTKLTESVRGQMMENRQYLSNYLLSGDTREVESLKRGMAKLMSNIGKTQEIVRASDLEQADRIGSALNKLREAEQSWNQNFAKPLVEKRRMVDSGNATVAELQIFYLQQDPIEAYKKSIESLDEAEGLNEQSLHSTRSRDQFISWGAILLGLLGTIGGATAGYGIAQKTASAITEPLTHLIHKIKVIGETGDLDQQVDVLTDDELGSLAHSFNAMTGYFKEMATVSQAIAGGDLTVDICPRSADDTLAKAFTEMTGSLRGMVKSVRDGASQVASGSAQVASASEESAKINIHAASAIDEVTSTMHEMSINVQNMVKNTQMQSSSVSETSASIDQMVASIQRVADTARVLLDISQRSREEVQSGISAMDKTTDGLSRINTSIQASSGIIGKLGERADDIGKIIEVIDDLAEQTNLLALNAAIEAARAGEHGLGFAVVADEVRKLAEKSAQSTREISDLIQNIQKEARKAVENMEKSTSIVNEGLTLGGDLNLALKKISSVVTEVYKFAQEIGAATNEQSHGSSQIAKATTRLNEITHEINSSVEEQASGAQAVVSAMEKMRELIQRSSSGATELAASSEQMSKMSRTLVDAMDRFVLDTLAHAHTNGHGNGHSNGHGRSGREGRAMAQYAGSYN